MAIENIPHGRSALACEKAIQRTQTVDAYDVYNKLSAKLVQLTAMIEMTYGNARQTFESMNDTTRDNYMWSCGDMANDCQNLLGKLIPTTTSMEASNV